jgi:hypothetical protein
VSNHCHLAGINPSRCDRTTSEMRGAIFQDPDRVILYEARM